MQPLAYLKIIRLPNAIMAGIAVLLGFWLSESAISTMSLAFLVFAAVSSTGFGNVINDIKDIETDRISHPGRPLPMGEIPIISAVIYACLLAVIALFSSFTVSTTHGLATLIPLILLFFYANVLKGTPLAGNLVVASLVAYAILYGAIDAHHFQRLIIPAFFAFLLNLSREIIKDLQDERGDSTAGIITTASLPRPFLKGLIYLLSAIYLVLLPLPVFLKHFGYVYGLICFIVILPLHFYRLYLIRTINDSRYKTISMLFKVEMLAGLIALAADKLLKVY